MDIFQTDFCKLMKKQKIHEGPIILSIDQLVQNEMTDNQQIEQIKTPSYQNKQFKQITHFKSPKLIKLSQLKSNFITEQQIQENIILNYQKSPKYVQEQQEINYIQEAKFNENPSKLTKLSKQNSGIQNRQIIDDDLIDNNQYSPKYLQEQQEINYMQEAKFNENPSKFTKLSKQNSGIQNRYKFEDDLIDNNQNSPKYLQEQQELNYMQEAKFNENPSILRKLSKQNSGIQNIQIIEDDQNYNLPIYKQEQQKINDKQQTQQYQNDAILKILSDQQVTFKNDLDLLDDLVSLNQNMNNKLQFDIIDNPNELNQNNEIKQIFDSDDQNQQNHFESKIKNLNKESKQEIQNQERTISSKSTDNIKTHSKKSGNTQNSHEVINQMIKNYNPQNNSYEQMQMIYEQSKFQIQKSKKKQTLISFNQKMQKLNKIKRSNYITKEHFDEQSIFQFKNVYQNLDEIHVLSISSLESHSNFMDENKSYFHDIILRKNKKFITQQTDQISIDKFNRKNIKHKTSTYQKEQQEFEQQTASNISF